MQSWWDLQDGRGWLCNICRLACDRGPPKVQKKVGQIVLKRQATTTIAPKWRVLTNPSPAGALGFAVRAGEGF